MHPVVLLAVACAAVLGLVLVWGDLRWMTTRLRDRLDEAWARRPVTVPRWAVVVVLFLMDLPFSSSRPARATRRVLFAICVAVTIAFVATAIDAALRS